MKCTKQYRLTYTEAAQKIVDSLSLEEKVGLMSGKVDYEMMKKYKQTDPALRHYNWIPYEAAGLPQQGVDKVLFCDGPRGVVCGVGKTTCFPVTMCRGATFDRDLEQRIGHAVGKEVLASKGNLFAGVCINLPYNPGWGRSQETYGEESYHLGEMGKALLTGVQEENVMACVKHYAFNSMENSRFDVSVDCTKRTEREVYLPHFKKCVDAGAACVMSSYNLYKGTHCGHHDYLLNEVLKKEWDFDGFVMSDFIFGITDTVEAANGGQDMEMNNTHFFGDNLVQAVRDGLVPEEKIDKAALRIVRTVLAFQNAQKAGPQYDETVLACPEHVQLALEAARKGITLLQNTDSTLPLSLQKTKKILLLGRLAKHENIGDHGSSRVYPPYVVTPYEGIRKQLPDAEIWYEDGSDLEKAKELARQADAVIFVVGYDDADEGEFIAKKKEDAYIDAIGGDRKESLGLHREDCRLIKEIGPLNERSVAILIGGNMILIHEWKDYIKAILMAYYPGMEGGTALAEILFGKVNPSGKLPFVVTKKESDLPQVKWETNAQYYDYYHGYAKLEKEGVKPELPYGFGLSYTTFALENPSFSVENDQVVARCKVKNTGERAGDEVVQMYVGFENSRIDRPVKLLRGFDRVSLQPGEEKEVCIRCGTEELCWYNEASGHMELEHMEYPVFIGTSSADEDLLKGTVKL